MHSSCTCACIGVLRARDRFHNDVVGMCVMWYMCDNARCLGMPRRRSTFSRGSRLVPTIFPLESPPLGSAVSRLPVSSISSFFSFFSLTRWFDGQCWGFKWTCVNARRARASNDNVVSDYIEPETSDNFFSFFFLFRSWVSFSVFLQSLHVFTTANHFRGPHGGAEVATTSDSAARAVCQFIQRERGTATGIRRRHSWKAGGWIRH